MTELPLTPPKNIFTEKATLHSHPALSWEVKSITYLRVKSLYTEMNEICSLPSQFCSSRLECRAKVSPKTCLARAGLAKTHETRVQGKQCRRTSGYLCPRNSDPLQALREKMFCQFLQQSKVYIYTPKNLITKGMGLKQIRFKNQEVTFTELVLY